MKKNYVKAGFYYSLGNIFIKGIAFLSLPIFTHILSTADFGRFNLFLSYENILAIIIGLGITGTVRTAYFDSSIQFNRYISSTIFLITFFSILTYLSSKYFFFNKHIFFDKWIADLLGILFISAFSSALYNLISAKYVIEGAYKANLFFSFIYTFLNISISIILCITYFRNECFIGRILGNTIPLFFIATSISFFILFKERVFFNKDYWKYAVSMGGPLIFHSLSIVIMQQIDKIIINKFCGDSYTGIYSLACTISIILTIILSSIDNAWAPWFYKKLKERDYTSLNKNNKKIVIFFFFITSIVTVISPEIIRIIAPVSYGDAIFSLIPLTISIYANFMYLFAINKEYFYKQTKWIALATIFTTILDIVLNYLFIPKFGYISAAYTTLLCKVVLFAIHWGVSKKIDSYDVVSLNLLLCTLMIVATVGGITIIFLDNYVVRFFILLLFLIALVYTYKDYLKKIIER